MTNLEQRSDASDPVGPDARRVAAGSHAASAAAQESSGRPEITLVLPGRAHGKGRPRFNTKTGRAYSDKQTRSQEELLRQVWLEAGRPVLAEGPLAAGVEVILARPRGHYRQDGSLSASGLRSVAPTGRPDLDNVVKLLDGLNTLAFRDDAQIVYIEARKRWASPDEDERTLIRIYEVAREAVAA